MQLTWDPSLSIGHELIDSQHIELFRLFDEFTEGCASGAGKEYLIELHKGLSDYTVSHFQAEEECMHSADYPQLEQHRRDHQRFKDDLAVIREEITTQGPTLMALIHTNKALVSWLVNHVRHKDQHFGRYLSAREKS